MDNVGRKIFLFFGIFVVFFVGAVGWVGFRNEPGPAGGLVWSLLVGGVVLGFILAGLLKSSMARLLFQAVHPLEEGLAQSATAVSELSSLTEKLSQNITEQASSLEETSSSLSQINSMTTANFENTQRANEIAQHTKQSAESGNSAITEMLGAMFAINDSSTKISKISKTIEEIAFQTNILALNAAVEAARAGEYGKGFAVVAEEVRNLARRSATAAKDTTQLIQENLRNAASGGEIATKAVEALGAIIENVDKIAQISAEITSASKEQTDGISQLSSVVNSIDKTTQQNAAATEENFSAMEALSTKVSDLQQVLVNFRGLIGADGYHRAATAGVIGDARGGRRALSQAAAEVVTE